jgi:hypothetical protein
MPGRKNFIGTALLVRYVNPISTMERKMKAEMKTSPVARALIARKPRIERVSARTATLIRTAIELPRKILASNLSTP